MRPWEFYILMGRWPKGYAEQPKGRAMQYSINIIGENGEDFLWRGDAEDRNHAEGLAMDAFKEEFGDGIELPQAHDVVHVVDDEMIEDLYILVDQWKREGNDKEAEELMTVIEQWI